MEVGAIITLAAKTPRLWKWATRRRNPIVSVRRKQSGVLVVTIQEAKPLSISHITVNSGTIQMGIDRRAISARNGTHVYEIRLRNNYEPVVGSFVDVYVYTHPETDRFNRQHVKVT